MRRTRYLGPAAAISVGAVFLLGCVATHSRHGPDDDPVVTGAGAGTGQLAGSVARAYQFLNQMMDLHAGGTTPRLVQSYRGGLLGLDGNTSSDIYDDALVIDAYLAEGTQNGAARAEVIGNGLRYLQAHDPSHDGRIMDRISRPPWNIRVTSTSPTRPAIPATWPGPGTPSHSCIPPPECGPTWTAPWPSGTGSTPAAGTPGGLAATPAAPPDREARSNGSQPSTTSTCSPSSGCWPGKPGILSGHPGRRGHGGSSWPCGTPRRAGFTWAPATMVLPRNPPRRWRTSTAGRIWLSGTPRTSNRSTGNSATWP